MNSCNFSEGLRSCSMNLVVVLEWELGLCLGSRLRAEGRGPRACRFGELLLSSDLWIEFLLWKPSKCQPQESKTSFGFDI